MNKASPPASGLPTLRQLQFLAALAAHGGFIKAADAVGVTQPTLSAGVKELEATLGVRLVERGRAGVALTSSGEEAAARAMRILTEVEELARAVRGASAPLTGPFRLGAIPTIAPFLLPRALPLLRQRFPGLKLQLREDLTPRLVEGLRARTLDAAVIALPYEAAGVETMPFAEDEFLLALPPGHKLCGRNDLTPENIPTDELLLLEDGHCLRDHVLSLCRAGVPGQAKPDFSAASLHTLVQLVGGGLGVTLAPRLAVEGGVTGGAAVVLQAFNEPVMGRTLGMAWRKGGPRRADAGLLAEALRHCLMTRGKA
ncbi:MAG: LysR family transcriptional regulator [Alphaproteobacteria bacterium]|jgi:LysR family hydrogen peroxide-inducible transcriptional activator|nr:LysR family transcriptional regulator [Alphaproteobacteria bacterium]